MKNTGLQYTVRWKYGLPGDERGECGLVKPAGDAFYSDAESALLSEEEYKNAFDNTVKYMRDVLGWKAFPELSACCRMNEGACPVDLNVN